MKDLISVILPVYNRPHMLDEAVNSVLAQTWRPIEIIIVDDGSTDETGQLADALAAAHTDVIRVIHKQNGGPGLARESGRQEVRGEFIQYLDSDDLLLPGKFEKQVNGLRDHPECGVSYGWTRYREADGLENPFPWKGSGRKVEFMFPSFLRERWWDTPTPLYRAEVCDGAGAWSDLRLEEDWEYDCRIAALGTRLHYCEDYIAVVRDHEDHRLCKGTALDPVRLKERARAHALIYSHAIRAGVSVETQEMQHFARELFLLCRQCGAAGLGEVSQHLFELSCKASRPDRCRGFDMAVYSFLAGIVGWVALGKLACWSDRLRKW